MSVTFHNVTITIAVDDPREAYSMLQSALDLIHTAGEGIEWRSDSYTVQRGPEGEPGQRSEPRDTAELF